MMWKQKMLKKQRRYKSAGRKPRNQISRNIMSSGRPSKMQPTGVSRRMRKRIQVFKPFMNPSR